MIGIRPARPDERLDLEALQRRASLALDEYHDQLLAHPDAFGVPAAQFERGEVLVAEVDGAIAGFASLEGAELDGLFVEPNRWRQGIGRALVEAAVHLARRRGVTSVTLVSGPSAQAFYERCGFTAEGKEQTRFGSAVRMSR